MSHIHDEEHELASRLTTMLRDTDVPLRPLDVGNVVRNGRSAVSRRRVLTAGLAVGVTGLTVAGAPAVWAAARDLWGRSAPPSPAEQETRPFDPLRRLFIADAPGFTERMTTMTTYWQHTMLDNDKNGAVEVAVIAPGHHRDRRWSETVPRGSAGLPKAPLVNGRHAVWLVPEAEPTTYWSGFHPGIAWQYDDDAWAMAGVANKGTGFDPSQANSPERRQYIHQVAESVRLVSGKAMTLPFSVSAPPSALRVVKASYQYPRGGAEPLTMWSRLYFSDGPDPDSSAARPESAWLHVGLDGGESTKYGAAGRGKVVLFDESRFPGVKFPGTEVGGVFGGNTVSAQASDAALAVLGGTDGLLAYGRSITPVSDPRNPDNWTARPLR